jgi:hypothetical protein
LRVEFIKQLLDGLKPRRDVTERNRFRVPINVGLVEWEARGLLHQDVEFSAERIPFLSAALLPLAQAPYEGFCLSQALPNGFQLLSIFSSPARNHCLAALPPRLHFGLETLRQTVADNRAALFEVYQARGLPFPALPSYVEG